MDFLDPRKTRAHRIRLMFGYMLVAIAIGLGTVILVYGASGYSINTKTGDIIQNGLLFVDSKPGGADIYLNNKKANSPSSARLVLPAGDYDLVLKRDGYRDWSRKFTLQEHTIERFVYPFLFPNDPVETAMKTYSSAPPLITESPDRSWLLVQVPGTDSKTVRFDEYDTGNLTKPSEILNLPASLLTNSNLPGSKLTEVEWSTDNRHLLLKHNYRGGNEFIIFDREDPSRSINVDKLLKVDPTEVALRNKKADQLYVYNKKDGVLRLADVASASIQQTLLKDVLAFKPYGTNLVSYVTSDGARKGEAEARIWNNNRTYPLRTLKAGDKYLIDVAQFQGHYYFVAGSNATDLINVYKDPLSSLQNPKEGKARALFALNVLGAKNAEFSSNARFIAAQSGQSFVVYDIEEELRYNYSLKAPLDGPMQWMDGHRLIGSSKDDIFVMDYDATNQQLLGSTSTSVGGFFSRDYNQLFTLAPVKDSKSIVLQRLDMRAGVDLPRAN